MECGIAVDSQSDGYSRRPRIDGTNSSRSSSSTSIREPDEIERLALSESVPG
jgi:hypothetical protein